MDSLSSHEGDILHQEDTMTCGLKYHLLACPTDLALGEPYVNGHLSTLDQALHTLQYKGTVLCKDYMAVHLLWRIVADKICGPLPH